MVRIATIDRRGRDAAVIRQLRFLVPAILLIAIFVPAAAAELPKPVRWQVWLSSGSSIRVAAVVPECPVALIGLPRSVLRHATWRER